MREMGYRQTSDLSRTLVGNELVDQSDVVEHRLSALLQRHLHSRLNTWLQWIGRTARRDELLGFGTLYIRGLMVTVFEYNRQPVYCGYDMLCDIDSYNFIRFLLIPVPAKRGTCMSTTSVPAIAHAIFLSGHQWTPLSQQNTEEWVA